MMEDTEENESCRRKNFTCATLPTINPTRTPWNVSLALRGERPATTAHAISISQKPNQKHRKQQSIRQSVCSGDTTSKKEGGIFKLFTPQQTSEHLTVSCKTRSLRQ